MASRNPYERLQRARSTLEKARASSADPWRVSELQLAYDRALEAALDAHDVDDADGPPAPRHPEPELQLAWVDESGRRRGGRGGAA